MDDHNFFFVILVLLIPKKHSSNGGNIDVYAKPVIDQLKNCTGLVCGQITKTYREGSNSEDGW